MSTKINKRNKGRINLLISKVDLGKIDKKNKIIDNIVNIKTLKVIEEAKKGKTIHCVDFNDYLNKVNF